VTRFVNHLRLGRLCTSIKDGTHGSYDRVPEGVVLLSAKNVLDGKVQVSDTESQVSQADAAEIMRAGAFNLGDVLLTIVGTIGRVAVHEIAHPAVFQRSVASLRPGPLIDNRYLGWAMRSQDFQDELARRARQSAQAGVYLGDLADIPVPLPGLAAQRRIANFLDDQVARIESVILAKSVQQSRLIELRVAHMNAALNISGAPLRRLAWVLALGAVGIVVNPSSYFVDQGVPFIHGYNVREGFIDTQNLRRISPANSALLGRSRLAAGDVLVVRAGYPGRAAVVTEDLAGGNCASVLLLRPRPHVDSRWIATFFNSSLGKAEVDQAQYGAAQGVINLSDVKGFMLPVPELSEQRRRLTTLDEQLQQIHSCAGLLTTSIERCEELKGSLITAAVTGEFDVSSADGSQVPA